MGNYVIKISLDSELPESEIRYKLKGLCLKLGKSRVEVKRKGGSREDYENRILAALESVGVDEGLTTDELQKATKLTQRSTRAAIKALEAMGLVYSQPAGFKNAKRWFLDGEED